MTKFLSLLEYLARYGIFDILFGIGILGYLRRLLRRRIVKALPGIDILPRITPHEGQLEMEIRNSSREPLYLYRATFRPGYYVRFSEENLLRDRIASLFVHIWKDGELIDSSGSSMTTRGDFLLRALDQDGDEVESLLLEPRMSATYVYAFDPVPVDKKASSSRWTKLIKQGRCGGFRAHFVHGTRAGILELQI